MFGFGRPIRRRGFVALTALGVLVPSAVLFAVAADARKAEPGALLGSSTGSRMLPLSARSARTVPADVSTASLLLEGNVYRPLPNVPGAPQTTHLRINNRGQTVGVYAVDDAGTRVRGFLMQGRRVTRIDVPGAMSTIPNGINDRGQVVGGYVERGAPVDPVTGESPTRGFLWERGRIKTLDVPGSTETAAYEINNHGRIVGYYSDAAGAQHGLVLDRGKFIKIDHPDATDDPNLTGTRVVGVNDHGKLVGSYGDDTGTIRAWMWDHGKFTTIHPSFGIQSEASQVDNRGRIVGRYIDPDLRSFLLSRGRYTRIDVPGRCDTAAFDLNARGQILIATAGTTDGTTCPGAGRAIPRS